MSEKAPKKKGKMQKQIKGIICLGAVLAVMGGGFAYLKLTEPAGEESSESSELSYPDSKEGAGITIITDSEEEGAPLGTVKSVVIKNAEGEIKVKQQKKESSDDEDAAAIYTLDGYDDIAVNTAMVGTLANNANGLESTELIDENCTDLGKYGLEKPEVTVELTYESGNVRKFFIGDQTPSSSDYYVRADGSNTVYAAASSKLMNYQKPVKDFIENTVLESPEDETPRVDKLTIEREDLDYDIVLEYDKDSEDSYSGGTSSTHKMIKPVEAFLSGDKSSTVISGMFGLYAKDIYSVYCKESDIAGAGLNEPFCKVSMKCDNGKTYTLLLSEFFTDENGEKSCYAMLEKGKVIYILSETNAQWLTVMPNEISSKIMIASYVWNVRDLSVKCSDGSYVEFKAEPTDSEKEVKDLKAEDFKVTKNGEDFDAERYRKFYAFVIDANAEELAIDVPAPEGEPMAEITFTDSYDNKKYTYQFYDDSMMKVLVTVNGEPRYYSSKAFVNTLMGNIKKLDTGEEFVTTW